MLQPTTQHASTSNHEQCHIIQNSAMIATDT
jgi:hypothetical protein